MTQRAIPAVFMRGGTSKGLFFHERDLPRDAKGRDALFLAAIGSPDPYGRQLDGMGGGISSLSKIVIVAPSERDDADVAYTFGQVAVGAPTVDYGSNCGNLTAAVGHFAVDEGLALIRGKDEALLRLHNRNTGKIIESRFALHRGHAAVSGDFELDGVAGAGAPIVLTFHDPGGAVTGHLLPSGRSRDTLDVPEFGQIEVSLVDATTACVFVAADALGLGGGEMPEMLEADAGLMRRLEALRHAAAEAMGLTPVAPSVPKLALIAPPMDARSLRGRAIASTEVDLTARAISMERPHRALPLTVAMCLAVAAKLPGTIAESAARSARSATLRLGHPSGVLSLDAHVGAAGAERVVVRRTARRLMAGHVYVPDRGRG